MNRCRHCYKDGHNVRTCPVLKKSAAEGSSYAKYRVDEIARTNSKKRSCTFCNETGHNVKTCQLLVNRKIEAITKTVEYRAAFAQACKNLNIRPGTMVYVKENYYSNNKLVGMITGLEKQTLIKQDSVWNIFKVNCPQNSVGRRYCAIPEVLGAEIAKILNSPKNWSNGNFETILIPSSIRSALTFKEFDNDWLNVRGTEDRILVFEAYRCNK